MKYLSSDKRNDMANQIALKARDVDVCMFNILDGTLDKELLLDCLMFYQNKDGGFKGGLHIDNYNINSSPYQVYEALRLLDMAGFDSSCDNELFDAIINKAFNYLYNRCEIKDNKWNPNVITNNQFAHAKIFTYNDENMEMFGYNPTAAIIGYTLLFCKPTKAYYKKALKMLDVCLKDFEEKNEFNKYEAISFMSLLNSLRKLEIYSDKYEMIENKLVNNVLKKVSTDFNDQGIHPLECGLYLNNNKLEELKNLECDFLIDSIKSFGLWDSNCNWGYNDYPEEDSASLKWIGATTVNNYYYLKKCGRIE
ncbi:MAG: hypothetical protein IKP77_02740 [Acholeplasmatales bacterium]|nr:hypothetical protein [Acholeplasmatales bacterium]